MPTPADHFRRAEELLEEADDLLATVRAENAKTATEYDAEKLFDAVALAELVLRQGQGHATLATCMPHTHTVT